MEALLEGREVEEKGRRSGGERKTVGIRDATCMPIFDSFESLINK
ncbi:MAG TPA: hypothetical protein VF555_15390 [Variovorax sp.]|jgi:hypothetical protein|nr:MULTISPECIES: hypothetical protein [unclassified Variovorax]